MTRVFILAAAVFLAAFGLVSSIAGTIAEEADPGDALAGRCAYCHGADGISPLPIWPSLAGLESGYLERQLDIFSGGPEGGRSTAPARQMHAISASLSAEQRRRLASYYASMEPPHWRPRPESLGHTFYSGDGVNGNPSCASCHGNDGAGDASLNAPRLGGQSARYIASQLRAYKNGQRDDQGSGMAAMASALDDSQIEALAEYLADRRSENHDE